MLRSTRVDDLMPLHRPVVRHYAHHNLVPPFIDQLRIRAWHTFLAALSRQAAVLRMERSLRLGPPSIVRARIAHPLEA